MQTASASKSTSSLRILKPVIRKVYKCDSKYIHCMHTEWQPSAQNELALSHIDLKSTDSLLDRGDRCCHWAGGWSTTSMSGTVCMMQQAERAHSRKKHCLASKISSIARTQVSISFFFCLNFSLQSCPAVSPCFRLTWNALWTNKSC